MDGVFFFFKQKAAYEMRISDWRSDVCSSDLNREIEEQAAEFLTPAQLAELSKHHTEEQERLRRWIESARAQAGMDPRIPEHAAAAADVPEQPQIGRASCRERVCKYV